MVLAGLLLICAITFAGISISDEMLLAAILLVFIATLSYVVSDFLSELAKDEQFPVFSRLELVDFVALDVFSIAISDSECLIDYVYNNHHSLDGAFYNFAISLMVVNELEKELALINAFTQNLQNLEKNMSSIMLGVFSKLGELDLVSSPDAFDIHIAHTINDVSSFDTCLVCSDNASTDSNTPDSQEFGCIIAMPGVVGTVDSFRTFDDMLNAITTNSGEVIPVTRLERDVNYSTNVAKDTFGFTSELSIDPENSDIAYLSIDDDDVCSCLNPVVEHNEMYFSLAAFNDNGISESDILDPALRLVHSDGPGDLSFNDFDYSDNPDDDSDYSDNPVLFSLSLAANEQESNDVLSFVDGTNKLSEDLVDELDEVFTMDTELYHVNDKVLEEAEYMAEYMAECMADDDFLLFVSPQNETAEHVLFCVDDDDDDDDAFDFGIDTCDSRVSNDEYWAPILPFNQEYDIDEGEENIDVDGGHDELGQGSIDNDVLEEEDDEDLDALEEYVYRAELELTELNYNTLCENIHTLRTLRLYSAILEEGLEEEDPDRDFDMAMASYFDEDFDEYYY